MLLVYYEKRERETLRVKEKRDGERKKTEWREGDIYIEREGERERR